MTRASDSLAWSPVHDLALIYLALMHGTDAEIAPSEMHIVGEKLREWVPEAADRVDDVMAEVMLIYMSESSDQMLEMSVASLRHALPKGQRIAVLNDLADIASADGMIVPGEVTFIQQLAHQWDVDQDIG